MRNIKSVQKLLRHLCSLRYTVVEFVFDVTDDGFDLELLREGD
jgi:hypothetical protein